MRKNITRRFGRVERRNSYDIAKKIGGIRKEGNRSRGRPKRYKGY